MDSKHKELVPEQTLLWETVFDSILTKFETLVLVTISVLL